MTQTDMPQLPFELAFSFDGPIRQRLFSMVKGPLERFFGLSGINDVYARAAAGRDRQFLDRLVDVVKVSHSLSSEELARLPRQGPVVVVANHPFGGMEGILLASLLRSIRPDAKIMANFLLERIAEMRDLFIFVDPFGGEASARANLKGLRQAIDWLRDGGMLGVFPAGEVAHLRVRDREVSDSVWNPTVARLIRRTGATAVPVFFHGTNSALFQVLGLVHPRVRTALLPHEFLKLCNRRMDVRIGKPIAFEKLKEFGTDEAMMTYLRQRTYLLAHRTPASPKVSVSLPSRITPGPLAEIVPEQPKERLAQELAGIPTEQVLTETPEYAVIAAEAEQIPQLLEEIGRLREITFRQTGEGTGRSSDLDQFDSYYVHLFVWSKHNQQVVGAYRMGPTDRILDRFGPAGLYTTTLFDFKPALLKQLNPALELGRSFVRPEYQKTYAPLMLLWKGIGQYIVRHPRYNILVGPVSISNTYNTVSRQLMVAFLQLHTSLPGLAKLVKPKMPFGTGPTRQWRSASALVGDLDEVSSCVSEIEADQKGIPILLRQYLKLGGRMLGFNLDPGFSDVLDSLMYTDLLQTDRRIAAKYMGKEGADVFFRYHEARLPKAS